MQWQSKVWTGLCKTGMAVGLALIAVPAQAAVPTVSLLEGTLATAGGGPAADGNYSVKVALYKDAVGGAPLWSEQATIAVSNGQFQHPLGSVAVVNQAVLQAAAYIGLAVASDPELPRKPLHASIFAARAGAAEALACSGCISSAHLEAQLASDIKTAVKSGDLADVAKSGAYADLIGAPNLATLVKTTDIKKVATTGSYNDLTEKPVMAALNAACGTGLLVKGIKADGSLDCAAGGGSTLPADGISQVTNGVMFNTFVDSMSGKKDIPIPDFAGPGVTDTLDFPDIGQAQKIWIDISVINSDMKSIKIELYGPNMSSPYLLYNGGQGGNSLATKFNLDTPIVTGDMNKDWVGKNIKGLWSITVRDLSDNTPDNIDGKFSWSVNIQTLSNKKLQVKGDLVVDGNVYVTGVNQAAQWPRYRWNVLNTHDYSCCWVAGNNAAFFGGIAPSTWTDGNAQADGMSADKNVLRTLFNKDGRIYPNLTVFSETTPAGSSTDGKVGFFLMRIKNSTQNDITWSPKWYATSYAGWSERSSFAFNGVNMWNSGGNNYGAQSQHTANVTVPKNRVNTAIFAITASSSSTGQRNLFFAFHGDSLALPAGLSYVDDLDTATGDWTQ